MKGHIDLPENAGRVGTFTHDEAGTPVHIQPVVPANAETGEPLDLASEATLTALGAAVATLNAAASAIKSAVESLNGKATVINTGAVVGTVELGAASLSALENVTAMVANFPATQQVFGAVDADTGLTQALTDAQLRAAAVAVSGTLALDAPTLLALETINVGNFPATQPISADALPLPTGAATQTTLAALLAKLIVARNTDDPFVAGEPGYVILARRRDSDTSGVSADGDLDALYTDEAGRLKVATQPASVTSVTGNITASAQNVSIKCDRFSNLSVSMSTAALAGHNISFECSNNTTNGTDGTWYGVQAVRSNANTVETSSGVLAATPAYMWHVNVGDYAWFRVRSTAHTSGTAAYILRPGSYATEPIPAGQITGTQPVSGSLTSAGTTTNTPATPTPSIVSSAATTNGTVVKASAGTIYGGMLTNTGAAAAFFKLYNSTTVTVGTTAVALTIPIPAGGSVPFNYGPQGMRFGTGICFSITNLAADADTTAVAAGQVKVNLSFL